MCDNRTSEFLSIARGLPGSDRAAPSSSARPPQQLSSKAGQTDSSKSNPAYAELKNFHRTAGGISKDIAATSALLTELTGLVRNSSVFSDDSQQINNLVVRIKTSIENLNARLDQAAYTIQQQKRRLGNKSQAGQEAENLVDGLKTEFAEAASDFKKVLQQRTDNMKETDDFQRQVYGAEDDTGIPNISALSAPPPVYHQSSSLSQHGGGGPPSNNNSFPTLDLTSGMMAAGETTAGPSLPRPHGIANGGGGAAGIGAESGIRNRRESGGAPYSGSYSAYGGATGAPLTPLDIQRMEEESGATQMMQLIPDQDYLRERADAMEAVESNIVELGTIFNKLAVMVSEHREMVQRVEDNVDDANANVNLSLGVLSDTLTSLRTNRALALRVFSVLVVFIVMFIIFFA